MICFEKNAQVYEHVIKVRRMFDLQNTEDQKKRRKKKCLKLLQADEEMK